MRILIIAYACQPKQGSEEGQGWNWPLNLALKGIDVTVLTRSLGKEAIEIELNNYKLPNLKFEYIDVNLHRSEGLNQSILVYFENLLWQHTALKFAKRHIQHFDLVHHITWSGLYIGSYFWKLGKPFIFGPCGGGQITPPAFLPLYERSKKKEIVRNLITKFYPLTSPTGSFPRHSQLILVTNEETKTLAYKAGAKRVELFLDSALPPEYVPPFFPSRKQSNKLNVLWVGRLRPRKGLILALQAIKLCDFPIKLTILGDGELGYKVPSLLKALDLEKKVEWLGSVPWMKVKEAYLENDVFLFSSIRDSFGGQLLEAMAHGLPVIALDQSGVKTFIPDEAGIKIPCKNPIAIVEEMKRAMESLWVDQELRIRMGKVAYSFASLQTWDRRAEQMYPLYESLDIGK